MVVFGAEIDGGKRGGGDRWEQVTTSLVESVVQQLAGSRCPAARRRVGGKRTASGRRQGEDDFYCRQKATFGSSEDEFLVAFGVKLDCGKRGEADCRELLENGSLPARKTRGT